MTTPLDEFNKRFPVGGGPPTTTSTLDEEARRILDAFNAKFPVGGAGVSPPPSGEPLAPSPAPGEVPTQDRPDSEIMQWIEQQSFRPAAQVVPGRTEADIAALDPNVGPFPEARPTGERLREQLLPPGVEPEALPEQLGPLRRPVADILSGAEQLGVLSKTAAAVVTDPNYATDENLLEKLASALERQQAKPAGQRMVEEGILDPLNFLGLGLGRQALRAPGAVSVTARQQAAGLGRLAAEEATERARTSLGAGYPIGAPFERSLVVVDAAHPGGQRLIFGSERDLERGALELGQRDVQLLPGDAPLADVQRAAARLEEGPPPVTMRGITRRPGQRDVAVPDPGPVTLGETGIPSGRFVGEAGDIDVMRLSIRRREAELDRLRRKVPKKAAPNSPINQSIRAKEAQLATLKDNFSDLINPEDVGLDIEGVIRTEPFDLHLYPGSPGRKRVGELLPGGVPHETGPGEEPALRLLAREPITSAYYAANTPQKAQTFKTTVRQEGVETAVSELDDFAKVQEAESVYNKLEQPPSQPPSRPPGQPAGVDDPPPRRSADALTDDMDLPTWEASRQGIMRKWEAARAAEGADTALWFDEGASLMERLGITTFDEATMNPVFRVLHGEVPRESLTPALRDLYDYVKGMQALEEKEMLEFLAKAQNTSPNFLRMDAENFASKMMAHPDYFPRGWSQGGVTVGEGKRPFGLVTMPRFTRARIDASYSDLRNAGLTPRSWNPIAMMAERRIHGIEYRENVVMMNRLYKEGLAKSADNVPAHMMDDAALKGWRIPQIGHLFQGRPVLDDAGNAVPSNPIYVPNYVANILEQVYHPPVSDALKRVKWFTNGFKGAKLAGSLFQHIDITQRAVGSGLTPTGLLRGAPLRYGSLLKDVIATQFSPRSRKALRTKMLSTDRVRGVKNFGLTYRMLVEEGLNLQADTSIIQREMIDFLDTTPKRILPVQKFKELNDWWQSGLFDGVYMSAQKWSLENFIIPQIRRTRPNATPRQVAAEASEAANLIFSTPTRTQSMITDPTMRKFLENFLFSINENESLLRLGARAVSVDPRAGLAREQVLGLLTAMTLIGNGINFKATGEPLPWSAYNPINYADPYAFFGVGYANKFLSPQFPGLTGSAGQPIHVDIMGQMDTPLRIADPFAFVSSRLNVPYRALIEASVGETFYGQDLDTIPKRFAHLAQALGVPISGISGIGALVERFPGVQEYIPRGEARLGVAGQVAQMSGVNLRSATVEEAIKAFVPNFDDLPETLRSGQKGLSQTKLRTRMGRVLNGTVRSDPLFPGLVFKEGRPQFLEEQKVEREVEAIRKQYGGR